MRKSVVRSPPTSLCPHQQDSSNRNGLIQIPLRNNDHRSDQDGGQTRYYQDLFSALTFQGPVSCFGDTAANAGILALLESNPFMKKLLTLVKTVFASMAAACFRMILMPSRPCRLKARMTYHFSELESVMKLGEVVPSHAPGRSYLGQGVWHRYSLVRTSCDSSSSYILGSLSYRYRLSQLCWL